MSAFYSIFHGKKGLTEIATRINLLTSILHSELTKSGFSVLNSKEEIFDTVTINIEKSGLSKDILKVFGENKINLREINDNYASISINETTDLADLEELLNIFNKIKNNNNKIDIISSQKDLKELVLNKNLRRIDTNFLHQDVFHKYSSETQLLRYIYYLQSKDISLANSMISLGSCTMKMNATSELVK
jgi:glycine dehydrogenase